MNKLFKLLFKPNNIWSIGLYSLNNYSFDISFNKIIKVFNTKKFTLSKKRVHTFADPFLISHNDELFIFMETQSIGENGKIKAYKTKDLKSFEDLGIILKEDYHLSYPYVFKNKSEFFLIPESQKANEINLYKFKNFPFNPLKLNPCFSLIIF